MHQLKRGHEGMTLYREAIEYYKKGDTNYENIAPIIIRSLRLVGNFTNI